MDFLLVLIELFDWCYGWGSTNENKLKIGILQGVGQYLPNFHVESKVPSNHFCTVDRRINAYNSVAAGFHTQKFCNRLSSNQVQLLMEKGCFAFWPPWGLSDNVRCSSKGSLESDFLLLLIERFSLGVTSETLRANIDWKSAFSLQRGQFDQKFQIAGVTPTKDSSCCKTRVNVLSWGIRMLAVGTRHKSCVCQTDGRAGGRTDSVLVARPRCMQCIEHGKRITYYVGLLSCGGLPLGFWVHANICHRIVELCK